MARKSTAEERVQFVAAQRAHDPKIRERFYVPDLLNFLNYHNRNTDMKNIRKWAVEYQSKRNPKTATLLSLASDFELRSIGMMARAIEIDAYVSLDHVIRVDSDIDLLIQKYTAVPKTSQKPDAVAVQKPVEVGNKHVAEVNAAIDAWISEGTEFSMKSYLTSNNVKATEAKVIAQSFANTQNELKEAVAGTDDQLKEGYSYLGRVKLRKFLALINQLILDCAQQVVTAKVVRKPRQRKVKPPGVVASKMKYLRSFPDLGLNSELPEKIIGANQVLIYDTDRRRMFVYTADEGAVLGIKGTTITGFSIKDSSVKILRKPEEVLKGNLAKRAFAATYKALKAKAQAVNGRVNDKMIILKVFN